MRLNPWRLTPDDWNEKRGLKTGEYYRIRTRNHAFPELWTWNPGNLWDWLIGNMWHTGEEAFSVLKLRDQRRKARQEWWAERIKKLVALGVKWYNKADNRRRKNGDENR